MVYCLNPACASPENLASANFCQACGSGLTLNGRYRAQSLLGEGGFGRTFLASDAEGDRCVIKQLYPSAAGEDSFAMEAERLRKLGEHPQIPRLIEAINHDLGQFLVQQFAPGDNLESRIEREGPWTQEKVRSLLTSLVPVLQYVHSFDIIHRDIKPANIIVNVAGDDIGGDLTGDANNKMLPMLVDFGAAKWVRHTPAKTVIGSAGYAAPEQSMGQATFASDIYSLGLTCLYLLTSIHPFSLYSAAEDRWVWQDYLPQPVESRFAQVLDQMVARSLQQRYSSMDEVALDLQFSRNLLRHASKQLLSQAKDSAQKSIAPLVKDVFQKNALQDGLRLKKRWQKRWRSFLSLSPLSLEKSLAPRPKVVVSQQWQRCYRITKPIGVMQAIATGPSLFATAGTSGSIQLWHLASGQLIHTFQRRRLIGDGHTAAVTALAFHPDGRALYSASSDGTIKEWDSLERCLLNTLFTGGWSPTDLAITADGQQLINPNSDGKIVLWEIATLLPTAQLAQHQQGVNAVALLDRQRSRLTSSSQALASASDDGTVKLWKYPPDLAQTSTPLLAKTINIHTSRSRKPVFSSFARVSESDAAIAVAFHSLAPGQTVERQTAERQTAERQTDPQAVQLVVATASGGIQLFTLDDQLNPGAPQTLYQSPYPITAFALSVDGYLAVGSEDSMVTLWQLATGDCVAKLAHDWGISAIAFSPNGQRLIIASADEIITVWQRDTRETPARHPQNIT